MPTTVKNVLDAKGYAVVAVDPSKTLQQVAEILNEKKIGAVVIVGVEQRIAGIFTERDLVRSIAKHGCDVLSETVRSVMTTTIQHCRLEQTVDEVMAMMTAGRFRHVPVEKDGQLAGIISIGDVVKTRMQEVEMEAEQMKAYIAS